MSNSLPVVGQVGPIPVALIQPFKEQPRKHFDEQALQDLAASIAAEGQRTPAWVIPEGDGYGLIAGERRLRACRLAGVPTLLCEVRAPENAADRYIDSVMENFGRVDCTAIEAARAVQEVIRIRFPGDPYGQHINREAAKVFARSEAWVAQHRQLLNLCPEVMRLLEPPARITTQVAVSLSNLRPELQQSLAHQIVHGKMKFKAALAHIRNSVTNADRVVRKGKRSRPYEDFKSLKRFLLSLGEHAQIMLSMPKERFVGMFEHRPPGDLAVVIQLLGQRVEQLRRLESSLSGIRK